MRKKISIITIALLMLLGTLLQQIAPNSVYAADPVIGIAVGADNKLTVTFPEAMDAARGEIAVIDPDNRKIAAVVSSLDLPSLFTDAGRTSIVLSPATTGLTEVNGGAYRLALKYWKTAGGTPYGDLSVPFTANDTQKPSLDPLYYVTAGATANADKLSLYFDEPMNADDLANLDHYATNGTKFTAIGGITIQSVSSDKSTVTFNYPNASTALVAGTSVISTQSLRDSAGNVVRDSATTANLRTSTTLGFAQSYFDIRYSLQARNVIQVKDRNTIEIRFNSKIASVNPGLWTVQRIVNNTWSNYTTFTNARILPDGYTVAFTTAASLDLDGNKYRLSTAGNANMIQNIYGSTRPSGNQSIWFDLVRPEVKTVEAKSGEDNVIQVTFTKDMIGYDPADFFVYEGLNKLVAEQDYYIERVSPTLFEIKVKSSAIGMKSLKVAFPAVTGLVDGFRNKMLSSGQVYNVDLSVGWFPVPSGQGVTSIWAVNDGEAVKRDDLNNPNKTGNSAWDGSKVKLFGGRNEVLAFQIIVESGSGGIEELSATLPSLNRIGGPGSIVYTPPAADPTLYAGRPIQIFSQNYMKVNQMTVASWILPTTGTGIPTNPTGWVPNQLVPENALPGKGGFPLEVLPNRNQGLWFEVYTAKDLPAGVYTGTVNVKVDGHSYPVPVELKLFDFTLPDENSTDIMLYYEDDQVNRYHQPADAEKFKALQDSYRRLLHRNRVEFVTGTNLASDAYIAQVTENVRWYDGSAFTAQNGYEGPGAGVGGTIIPRTMYGPGTEFDELESAQQKSDDWMNFLNNTFGEGNIKTFLYMPDEPSSSQYNYIKQIAKNIKTGTGPGKDLPILVTSAFQSALASDASSVAPGTNNVIDIWLSFTKNYNHATALTQRALGNEMNVYNGQRPYSGVGVLDVPATDMRATMWGVLKHGMSSFFYWHSNQWWHNSSLFRGLSRYQNPWLESVTFRNSGNEFANGDGVLIYPGRNVIDPVEDRGIEGPISSIRLANIRRGIQDMEYMEMLKRLGKEDEVNTVLNANVPVIFTNPGGTLGFSQTGNAFENSRYAMAALIDELSAEPAPELGGTINGPSSVLVGEPFELTIGLEAAESVPNFTTLDVIVRYDKNKISFPTVVNSVYTSLAPSAIEYLRSPPQLLDTAVRVDDGEIRIILMVSNGTPLSGAGDLFKLKGVVKADAAIGNTTISLNDFELAIALDAYEVAGGSINIQIALANKSTLSTLINAAETLHNNATIGSTPGTYPSKTAFNAAIVVAKAVLNNDLADQDAVNAAVVALTSAITAFRASINLDPGVDRSALIAAIEKAQQRLNKSTEGTKIGQYPAGSKSTLQAAITAASNMRYNGVATQGQVNDAVSTLQAALNDFMDQIITLVPNGKRVSVRDLSFLVQYWNTAPGDANWSQVEKADIVNAGRINIQVLAAVARMILEDWVTD
ncbi:glycoside hydrolase domain-containing protein [Paenibacillus koleovorans]|uniref:glycoside hydrolase domain-containing protein n=1 Tax=Paenibacillus koleovorans TaxID=121608 RepID=UPI0013E2BD95|nr:glycoside hydrolase domain-containing protein [Paenibacillus koleovorans]